MGIQAKALSRNHLTNRVFVVKIDRITTVLFCSNIGEGASLYFGQEGAFF